MAQPKKEERIYTEEEYLVLDAASNRPNEFWFGRVFRREGESCEHVTLAGQLLTALHGRLRKSSWHAGVSLLRVRMNKPRCYAYPDIVIWNDEARWSDEDRDTLLSPVVIAEIVSTLTQERDCILKLDSYRRIPSVTDYLIVWPGDVKIEHYARQGHGDWCCRLVIRRDDNLLLAGLGVELSLSEIYDDEDEGLTPIL